MYLSCPVGCYSPQIGFRVRIFKQAPTGCASILLEADNGASAIVGSPLHGNTVTVARIQNVWNA